jgi:pimeloyl-ACP methyl ester carboxylesterase
MNTDAPFKHRRVRASGVELHCVELGARDDAPLMLFLHGFPEFWYSWRHQMREFADDFHVVAPDLRGYNTSDKPAGRGAYGLDKLVDDVRALIVNLGYDKCVLVGHDWGGAIAWQFAHTHPEMLDKLVVMNLPHPVRFYEGLATAAQLRRSWYIFFFQLPWLPEKLLSRDRYRTIAELFEKEAKNPDAFSDEDLEAYRQAASQPGALTAMLNYYRNILLQAFSFDPDDYTPLEVPTLLIWGEDDSALGKELTYGTERFVRDLQIAYIPECSHWVQQDRPAIVNRHMRSFVDAG